jgi:hypothetical protein
MRSCAAAAETRPFANLIIAMCYLVTIGTSESRGNVETLLGRDSCLVVHPSKNPSLRSVFPKGDQLFEVTTGHCSCDLVIPSAAPSGDEGRARLRAKYERSGWSEAKIGRALAAWDSAHERRLARRIAPEAELCAFLRALASTAGELRVLVHFYSDPFDTERIGSGARIRVPVDRLVSSRVIGEDRLLQTLAGHAVTEGRHGGKDLDGDVHRRCR